MVCQMNTNQWLFVVKEADTGSTKHSSIIRLPNVYHHCEKQTLAYQAK